MRAAILVLSLAVVLVAGCTAVGGPSRATIVMTEMRFSPNRIDLKVGQPVDVRIVNEGAQRHDLAFPALHMPGLSALETALDPGESTTITLRFEKSGVHTFICTIPGHFAAGMSGAAFVSP